MRDALIIPLNGRESLVITSDNSGAVGMKEQDFVKVAYDIVGYFSFRVAIMECLAAGAKPTTVVIQNFCGERPWFELVSGVEKGIEEIGIENIQITGSTESNFTLAQSVVGLNVIGIKSTSDLERKMEAESLALIGLPLVGNEVITNKGQVAPLSLFYKLSLLEGVKVWPVGSKGVWHEIQRMRVESANSLLSSDVDLHKSGGPATSFLVAYPSDKEKMIRELAGDYFRLLKLGD